MDALQHPMNTCFAASNRGCFAASNACFLASGACFAAFSGCFAASNACFAACSGVSLANITTMNWNVNLSTSVEDLWHHLLPLQRWFKTAHCSGFLGSMLISSSALSTMHLSMVKNSFMLYFWDHCIIHHGPQQTKNIKSLVQFQHSRFATMHPTHESLGSSNSNCWTPFLTLATNCSHNNFASCRESAVSTSSELHPQLMSPQMLVCHRWLKPCHLCKLPGPDLLVVIDLGQVIDSMLFS